MSEPSAVPRSLAVGGTGDTASPPSMVVSAAEAGIRLDRWFKRRFPGVTHGWLEKLLRVGRVRVDGKRAKASLRLAPGQVVCVPPLGDDATRAPRRRSRSVPTSAQVEMIRACVIYRDDDVIALNKPSGLATQGGDGIIEHVDGLLDALTFGYRARPKLTHRLDRDTSGVLLLGRTDQAAAALTAAFRRRAVGKTYWALTVGRPSESSGVIKAPLAKVGAGADRKMVVDARLGRSAVTDFQVMAHAGDAVAWLLLEPRTGRTHQLRAHAAHMGVPIVGDRKYGGADQISKGGKLHLHARAVRFPQPGGGERVVVASLPQHMVDSFEFFGFTFYDHDDAVTSVLGSRQSSRARVTARRS